VIDWEYARTGDPAWDLAIVTRGARRPFQVGRGLERLLEAYREHGGRDVAADHVRVYELCLIAGWYRDTVSHLGPHSAQSEIDRMRGLLRRLP
jgi:thiamine kinase-like enzyme